MKLLSALLVLLACGDSYAFQVVHPSFHVTTRRGVKISQQPPIHQSSSLLIVCHMLLNNDALNSNSSCSQQQTQHYFQNRKVNGEVAKPSHEEGSNFYPTHHQHQHCTGLRMAHGAICPETIAVFEKDSNPAIRRFVETYHKRGPLACEDLLSDPEVLPHLTKAMRDIHL